MQPLALEGSGRSARSGGARRRHHRPERIWNSRPKRPRGWANSGAPRSASTISRASTSISGSSTTRATEAADASEPAHSIGHAAGSVTRGRDAVGEGPGSISVPPSVSDSSAASIIRTTSRARWSCSRIGSPRRAARVKSASSATSGSHSRAGGDHVTSAVGELELPEALGRPERCPGRKAGSARWRSRRTRPSSRCPRAPCGAACSRASQLSSTLATTPEANVIVMNAASAMPVLSAARRSRAGQPASRRARTTDRSRAAPSPRPRAHVPPVQAQVDPAGGGEVELAEGPVVDEALHGAHRGAVEEGMKRTSAPARPDQHARSARRRGRWEGASSFSTNVCLAAARLMRRELEVREHRRRNHDDVHVRVLEHVLEAAGWGAYPVAPVEAGQSLAIAIADPCHVHGGVVSEDAQRVSRPQ